MVTGAQLFCVRSESAYAQGLAFSSDGRSVLSVAGSPAVTRIWDVESGESPGALPGSCDVDAMVSGLPWRVVASKLELAIESNRTAEPIAWVPAEWRRLTTHPSTRTWAGEGVSGFCLIMLELEEQDPRPG